MTAVLKSTVTLNNIPIYEEYVKKNTKIKIQKLSASIFDFNDFLVNIIFVVYIQVYE